MPCVTSSQLILIREVVLYKGSVNTQRLAMLLYYNATIQTVSPCHSPDGDEACEGKYGYMKDSMEARSRPSTAILYRVERRDIVFFIHSVRKPLGRILFLKVQPPEHIMSSPAKN